MKQLLSIEEQQQVIDMAGAILLYNKRPTTIRFGELYEYRLSKNVVDFLKELAAKPAGKEQGT